MELQLARLAHARVAGEEDSGARAAARLERVVLGAVPLFENKKTKR